MEQDSTTNEVDLRLVTRIVGSYVRHHKLAVDELAGLISEVQRSLGSVGRGPAPTLPEEVRVPAVPVRRSVQRDHVVCLECGFRGQMLRRHLRVAHGLAPREYRARWKLAADHPITAPAYSEQRSALARVIGLGRSRRQGAVAPAPATAPGGAAAAELDPAFAASLPIAKRPGRPRKQRA